MAIYHHAVARPLSHFGPNAASEHAEDTACSAIRRRTLQRHPHRWKFCSLKSSCRIEQLCTLEGAFTCAWMQWGEKVVHRSASTSRSCACAEGPTKQMVHFTRQQISTKRTCRLTFIVATSPEHALYIYIVSTGSYIHLLRESNFEQRLRFKSIIASGAIPLSRKIAPPSTA